MQKEETMVYVQSMISARSRVIPVYVYTGIYYKCHGKFIEMCCIMISSWHYNKCAYVRTHRSIVPIPAAHIQSTLRRRTLHIAKWYM